jgi:hypothetical protein
MVELQGAKSPQRPVPSPVDRIIASFFLYRYSQPCTARFFTSPQEAQAWLAAPACRGSETVPEGTPHGTKTQ